METTYLVTPKTIINTFILAGDREYFSNPIKIELLYSELPSKTLIVRDPHRGHTYPTNPNWVVVERRLTNKQRKVVA